MIKKNDPENHTWHFFRAGGFDQVRLDSGKDMQELDSLDQKLWVALACPVDNVHFDSRTLSFIDTDNDHRIRVSELKAAVKWTLSLIKNPDELVGATKTFTIGSINDSMDQGKKLLAVARNALLVLGKNETEAITVEDIQSLATAFSQKAFNGDGVITEEAATEAASRAVIREIIAVMGADTDRSGKPGITAEKAEEYFKQARAYEAWVAEYQRNPDLCPLKNATDEAGKAIAAVKDKVNDYFSRCAISEFDERAITAVNGGEKAFESVMGGLLSATCSEITNLPLARIQPKRPLPLIRDLNPAWADAVKRFAALAAGPLLGDKETLSESDWKKILASFSAYFAWQGRKPTSAFDAFEITKIRSLLAGSAQKTILDLIHRDKAESETFQSLADFEKLVRFHRDLYSLCTNFVNFKDFYAKESIAMFIAGTLFLDQRSCNLCLKIDDISKHSLMAAMAGTYLVYCECKRRGGDEKMNIVAAFTNGDSDNLLVGRNGVFYDRAGNDWDASIIKILENPISLRQAFWLPYKSLVRMIEMQVAKRATTAEAQSTTKLQQTAATAANVDKSAPPTPPNKLDIGIVAALGVAAGAIGTFVATLLGYASGIVRMGPLAIVAALMGLMLVISGPSLILAYIKLRKRNLGPILDASGWAMNAKACINVPFGAALTQIAILPPGAHRDLTDPYAEKKSPWPKVAVAALLLYLIYFGLNQLGFIYDWTGGRMGLKKSPTLTIEKK